MPVASPMTSSLGMPAISEGLSLSAPPPPPPAGAGSHELSMMSSLHRSSILPHGL